MEDSAQSAGKWRAWLELLRVPNLLTVPGDVLAGWLMAVGSIGQHALWLAIGTSLALYAFGLISNDIADIKTDARERPHRPLPSRRINPITAISVIIALAFSIPLMGWFAGRNAFDIAVLLFLIIILYNMMMKDSKLFGPLTLGLCRGLNLLLGAAAAICVLPAVARGLPAGHKLGLGVAALVLMFYTVALSVLARREVETGRVRLIGALLRGLLPLQAMFCCCASIFFDAGWAGWVAAGVLLALWPIASHLSKRFNMS